MVTMLLPLKTTKCSAPDQNQLALDLCAAETNYFFARLSNSGSDGLLLTIIYGANAKCGPWLQEPNEFIGYW